MEPAYCLLIPVSEPPTDAVYDRNDARNSLKKLIGSGEDYHKQKLSKNNSTGLCLFRDKKAYLTKEKNETATRLLEIHYPAIVKTYPICGDVALLVDWENESDTAFDLNLNSFPTLLVPIKHLAKFPDTETYNSKDFVKVPIAWLYEYIAKRDLDTDFQTTTALPQSKLGHRASVELKAFPGVQFLSDYHQKVQDAKQDASFRAVKYIKAHEDEIDTFIANKTNSNNNNNSNANNDNNNNNNNISSTNSITNNNISSTNSITNNNNAPKPPSTPVATSKPPTDSTNPTVDDSQDGIIASEEEDEELQAAKLELLSHTVPLAEIMDEIYDGAPGMVTILENPPVIKKIKTYGSTSITDNCKVALHFVLYFPTQNKVHTSSYLGRGDPLILTTSLANGSVIVATGINVECVLLAVPTMKLGERAYILSSYECAYGALGIPDSGIPPEANVLVDIEIVSVERLGVAVKLEEAYTPEERLSDAKAKKENGRKEFSNEAYKKAAASYNLAEMLLAPKFFQDAKPELQKEAKDLVDVLRVNTAMAYLKLVQTLSDASKQGEFIKKIIDACSKVILSQSNHVKAYFHRHKAYVWLGDIDKAEKDINRAYELNKNDSGIIAAVREIRKRRAELNEMDRDISRRMMQASLQDKPTDKFTYQPGNPNKSLFEGTFEVKEIEEAAAGKNV